MTRGERRAFELAIVLLEAAAALQGSETAPPGTVTQDLRDWLRESLRTRLLFGCFDEPLDDAGCRVVRAIIDRLDRAADAPAPAPHGWQPIETWNGEEAFFWLVEKDGRSSRLYPRLYRGEFGCWWLGAKATHWMPIPDPPVPPPPVPDRA